MEEDDARLFVCHVLMSGDDVDVAFARSTIVAACPGDHAGDYWITFVAALGLWEECLYLRV